jgi:murein DD-endopeptidase MepM/ murein hydrolase activator NlpD
MVVLGALLACARSGSEPVAPWSVSGLNSTPVINESTEQVYLPIVRDPADSIHTPTPDQPRVLPTPRTDPEEYAVQPGDTLGIIAQHYHISLDDLIQANTLPNPNILEIGLLLSIPAPKLDSPGPSFKVIPDSELVNSPMSADFNIAEFIGVLDGYLAQFEEEVDGEMFSGAQIVERVAKEFSVNPRLLLAVLEYQSGWITQAEPEEETLDYPMRFYDTWREGLYLQLAWAANNLNRGFYLWRVNGIGTWVLNDGRVVPINPTINAGTAGIQGFFSLLYDRSNWEIAISESGLFATYNAFFGYPFDYAVEPLIPPGVTQPVLQLPFETGEVWAFTGGPHGGWGDGSAWAALDFAPPGEALGCVTNDAWVVAMADGQILRASNGAVIQDLDGDGLEQTGWVLLYMHIESRDRVKPGTFVKAGEKIGHPSCEGGFSSGTHVHIARRYNGEWISADQTLPFVLDEWVSRGTGIVYDGYLQREGKSIEAWEGNVPYNKISREP